jgi:hypothetical protein
LKKKEMQYEQAFQLLIHIVLIFERLK